MRRVRTQFLLLNLNQCLMALSLSFFISLTFASHVAQLRIQGSIGPASADYLVRAIESAQDTNLILILLDTPGGLDKSMRQIVQSILTSKTPIAVYIAPNGARAASAGTYIVYASTIAAMAPSTHLGAATPVRVANGFNADTLTAQEALKSGVINLIAINKDDLLQKLDGMQVLQDGKQVKLLLTNPQMKIIEPNWRTRLLLVITDPTIAYLLLLLGIYGIFFELVNPGFVAPGVIGAASLLVALYALQLLPVNYAAMGLIVIGIVFIIAEAFAPSFGALGLGGTLAFIFGSILLMNTTNEVYQIGWSAIVAMAAVNIIIFIVILTMAIKARKRPVQHGIPVLMGMKGHALCNINLEGQAMFEGEIWSVYSNKPIKAKSALKVVGAQGTKLEVKALKGD